MRELSLHVLDALENSLEAGATCIELIIVEDLAADRLTITIRDNGRGMSEAQLARVSDPFFTTRSVRHVGLGIPLFEAAAERCNGNLTVASELGKGTVLQATFQHSHIDRAPLGDMTGTLLAIILGGPCDVHYVHRVSGADRKHPLEFEFHTADMRTELGGVPLAHPVVRKWLQGFITAGEEELRRSAPAASVDLGSGSR